MELDDFTPIAPVEFEIDGRKFSYKMVTGGDETEWLNLYIKAETQPDPRTGELRQVTIVDKAELTKCKLRNIVSVPYSKEIIKTISGIEQDWNSLNIEQRWLFLSKLKPQLLDAIIRKINEIDSQNAFVKKN